MLRTATVGEMVATPSPKSAKRVRAGDDVGGIEHGLGILLRYGLAGLF